uniref:DUF2894 domain-containing protein n=1 Tax=Ramlibacter sp. TaxID=1917967 RepID=UPI00184A79BC
GVRRAALPAQRARCEPLARLNDAIRAAAAQGQRGTGELASVRRFRRAWSGTRAEERVVQAALQKPSNAGPLNSQVLVLQSLELMRALPGDYLRRFVGHVEALLWLEAAGTPAASRPKRQRR